MSDPQYGPGGYLPDKAARRARKIVLREPLGKGWILASIIGAVVMVAIGVVYVLTEVGAPGAPYEEAGAIEEVDPRGAGVVDVDGTTVLVVRGAGGVQAFEAPPGEVVWCRDSGRIEAADGRVWSHTGQLRGGAGESLRPLPAEVRDGRLYVDPTADLAPPDERPAGEEPRCA